MSTNGADPFMFLNERISKIEDTANETKARLEVHVEVIGGIRGNLSSIEGKLDKVVAKLNQASDKLLVIDVDKAHAAKDRKFWLTLFGAIASSGVLGVVMELLTHHLLIK
jgi:hypothetical protein